MHEVWNALLEAQPDAAPTQDEVLGLLGRLGEMELLQSERAASAEALLQRRDDGQRRRRRGMLNPFSFRLPLGDPARWLTRLDPLAHAVFTPLMFWFWLLGMLVVSVVAATEWPALRSHASQQLLSGGSLALAWLIYPVMKALHELGHALALRRWGVKCTRPASACCFSFPHRTSMHLPPPPSRAARNVRSWARPA